MRAPDTRPQSLQLEPIGLVRSPLVAKADAARQPRAARGLAGRIELFPGRNFEHALDDLAGWEYIWVIFWFHLNRSWRPKVLPPRSASGRKGVFATRSPHRPNPLGLSAVRLLGVEGLTLHLADVDMVDGTPVLDIKPYVAYADAHPAARNGWLDTAGGRQPADPVKPYEVGFDALALEQAGWIEAQTGLAIRERIVSTLALGPAPHPYRRIRPAGPAWQLAIRDWRVRFAVDGRRVRVLGLFSGFRAADLARGGNETLAVHRRFAGTWPAPPRE